MYVFSNNETIKHFNNFQVFWGRVFILVHHRNSIKNCEIKKQMCFIEFIVNKCRILNIYGEFSAALFNSRVKFEKSRELIKY